MATRAWIVFGLFPFLALSACKKKESATGPTGPIETVSEKAVGVAFYPKSTEWGTGSSAGQDSGAASSSRQTDDPPDKVVAFYKQQIKDARVTSEGLGDIVHTNITGKTKDGADAEVVVMKLPPQKTQIFVSVARKK